MKKFITASLIIAFGFLNKTIAQANKNLSNLTAPTAINASLLPGALNSVDLGSAAQAWKNVYFKGGLFYGNYKTILFDTIYASTSLGIDALSLNTTGWYNTAVGYRSGYSNTTGSYNTAMGTQSFYSNTTGNSNTGFGWRVLYANTTGSYNIAVGYASGYSNTTGSYNTAIGTQSFYFNTVGSYNTAMGTQSLYFNTAGSYNTAMGAKVLYSNTTGSENTAIGEYALYYNKTGNSNVASGSMALMRNTTGSFNTAAGIDALLYNTTGVANTATGNSALKNNTIGNYNTAFGTSADVTTGNLTNATAIGYNAQVNASNKVVIGNTSVTVIGGWAQWSKFSDGRFKSNVKQNVPGLAFINKLKPVTYTLEQKKFDKFLGKKDSLINSLQAEYALNEKKIHTGFIAQEVERAAKEISYDFDGVNTPKNDKDNYSIAYADFVVPLVKAVQELSNQNDSLRKQNDDQQKQIDELRIMMQQYIQGNVPTVSAFSNISKQNITVTNENTLQQNIPNPAKNTTVINYSLPHKFTKASMLITDRNGKSIKQVTLAAAAKGSVNIDASMLAAGAYNYSLIVDGKLIASKQMVVAK